MRKRLMKITSLLLTAAMVVGTMAGCGSKGGSSDAKEVELSAVGEYPIVKEPIELSVFTMTMPNVEDIETNDFTKFLEEKTGINLTFETGTRDDWENKLNMSLQSGDYPDVILGVEPNLAKFGVKEGILIQLDDLIEANMPNYTKLMGEYKELSVETDGHIYSLLGINDCYHCKYGRKMWVNTYHLEQMGVDVPTTTEEFYDVCKKFLEYKPDGIAIGGAAPGMGWFCSAEEWLMNAFVLDPGKTQSVRDKTVVDQDGNVVCVATDDRYKEGLKYMNSLYELGAIYDGNFTQTQEQLRTLMNQEGEPVLFVPCGTISDMVDSVANPETYKHYEIMEPLEGPDGTKIATYFKYSGVSTGAFSITDKCQYPEAALRLADFFYSETGDLCSQYGAEEGTDWVLNPEGKVGLNGEPALYEVLNTYSPETQNHDWQDIGVRVAPESYRLGQAVDPNVDIGTADGLEKLLYDGSKEKMEPYAQNGDLDILPTLKFTDKESTEIQTISVEVEKYLAEWRTGFITGTKDLDKEWDSYKKGLDDAGLQTLLEVYQTAYDRQTK